MGAKVSIRRLPNVWDTAVMNNIPVFSRKLDKRHVSGVRRIVEKHAGEDVSFRDPAKKDRLEQGQGMLEAYKAKRCGSGDNDENGEN